MYVNDSHYLKVFVRRLRQKLGDDASQPRYIQTAWELATGLRGPTTATGRGSPTWLSAQHACAAHSQREEPRLLSERP